MDVAFANGERTWNEHANAVEVLAKVMRSAGHKVAVHKNSWVTVDDDFILMPRLVSMEPLEPSGVRTCTTIEVRHTDKIPAGVFEYQHSTGDDLDQSLTKGFDSWRTIDFVVFCDAILPKPEQCMCVEMEFPAKDGAESDVRRAVLGPVTWYAANPDHLTEDAEHAPFCSCCLFTSMSEELKDLLQGRDFLAIRFFASRDGGGSAQADCRINGRDWEPGKQALLRYVQKWEDAGFEFRKQYGIVQTVPSVGASADDMMPA